MLVSIIIPTHNRFECLFNAIDSCLNQTYKNIEIIVVDDNYDNKELRNKIKDRLKDKKYRSIKYVSKNIHLGGALARNEGVKVSSGDYLSFLDDDDIYYDNKIEKQLELFNNSKYDNLGLVYCYGDIYYPSGKHEVETTNASGNPLVHQMMSNICGSSFMMIKKDVFNDIGGFQQMHSHQDGVVLLNILAKGYNIDLCTIPLVKYYFHSKNDGITSVNPKILEADKAYLDMCIKYFDKISIKDQRRVMLKYYDDRNWNLIILEKDDIARKEIKDIFKKYKINKVLFKCIYRVIFSNHVRNKEKKFDREILMEDNNG